MNELTKPEQAGLLSLLRQDTVLPDVSDPYSREILLIETQVAGTTHVLGIEEVAPFLTEGETLTLKRVPDNPSDPWAIKVFNADGFKLGYVPRGDNLIHAVRPQAVAIGAGKELFARLTEKIWNGQWLRLRIQIFLRD